jgi:hypothetical protein
VRASPDQLSQELGFQQFDADQGSQVTVKMQQIHTWLRQRTVTGLAIGAPQP